MITITASRSKDSREMFLTSLTGRKYFFIIGVTDAVVTSALCYGVTSLA